MRLNAWRIAEPEAEWARDLVRQDWLTPCQANQLNRWHTADLVIGQYVVLDRLGGGCMGDVYKVRRFEREPDALARLSHPDIVTLHDAGADNGRLYLVLRTESSKFWIWKWSYGRELLRATSLLRHSRPNDEIVEVTGVMEAFLPRAAWRRRTAMPHAAKSICELA